MSKALIIGATSEGGLGQEIVKRLWESSNRRVEGWEISTPNQHALDVRDQDSIEEYIDEHGPFDQIVYCAGVNNLEWIRDLEYDDLVDTYKVNALGFAMVMASHEGFYPNAEGSATAIVSDSYRTPMRGSLAYSSSKTALTGIIRNMARELAPRWRVNGVSPGIIDGTPMTEYIDNTVPIFRGWSPDKAQAYEKTMIPMQRRVWKSEVAELVEHAMFGPQFMTGSILEITGGK